MELDEEELKVTQKYHEKRINYIHVPVRKEKGEEVMHLVEGWEYNRLLSLYKKELKRINEDIVLDDTEKLKQKAIVNEQIKELKKSFEKKKKPKYNRAKAEEETAKLIKKFEEGER